VLSLVTGIPEFQLGWDSALLSILPTVLLTLSIPWILGDLSVLKKRFFRLVFSGLLVSLGTLLTVRFVGSSGSGMIGGFLLILALILISRVRFSLSLETAKDMAPFLWMLLCLLAVNSIPWLKAWTFQRLTFSLTVIPIHPIIFRPFFSAYLYIFLSFILSLFLLKISPAETGAIFKKANQKAWRAVLAMALFGAMGQIIAFSGYDPGFTRLNPETNIAMSLANGLVHYSGRLYPLFAPFLGWVGTFLTGYGVASIMLFGKLQLSTAELLSFSPSLLASAMTVGASIGSISSPFKIAIAAPMCGAQGLEGEILRKTIPLGIGISLLTGLTLFLF
jgi:lactate permease